MEERARQVLEDFVFVETDKLVAYKMSIVLSQTTIQDLIRTFLDSELAEVCFLFVNMQESSKEVVNHLRIMIEEAEILYTEQEGNKTKIFVILLHFPPADFFKHCYPSLFLKGWDHYYLDTIAHNTAKGVVDIRDWFWQCCFPQQFPKLEEDTLLEALLDMLPQAIPVVVSHVYFGSGHHGTFNQTMDGLQRTEALNLLLTKEQNEIPVGRILCKKFRAYWKPSVMAEHLEKAAIFSRTRESTLNITESVQTNIKSLFFDFLVYMISRINEKYNLDILFDPNSSSIVKKLFLDILLAFPTPKLSQITLKSKSLPLPKTFVYIPKFPFFDLVFEIIEEIVELSQEEANVELDLLNDQLVGSLKLAGRSPISYQINFQTLQRVVMTRISEKMLVSESVLV